jgi:hypothetical protein
MHQHHDLTWLYWDFFNSNFTLQLNSTWLWLKILTSTKSQPYFVFYFLHQQTLDFYFLQSYQLQLWLFDLLLTLNFNLTSTPYINSSTTWALTPRIQFLPPLEILHQLFNYLILTWNLTSTLQLLDFNLNRKDDFVTKFNLTWLDQDFLTEVANFSRLFFQTNPFHFKLWASFFLTLVWLIYIKNYLKLSNF